MAAVRSQGRQDEIALLEPLVIAEPQRLSRAWTLDSRKRAQREARDELLRCAERQLEADPALAVSCLDLSEAIEVDARSQLVRQDIERRETERAALEAAEEARERERSMERKKRLRKPRIGQAEALAAAGNYADASAEVCNWDRTTLRYPKSTANASTPNITIIMIAVSTSTLPDRHGRR